MALPSSFRDPSGFLFRGEDGAIYRQVNLIYREDYDHLMSSGLYDSLVKEGLLIGHEEVDLEPPRPEIAYKVIKPEPIPFISYPYEWCFSQLKDAALLTLKAQRVALEFGMSLKDASAYNVQFVNGRPMLIDTLSFERHREGRPWVAYRQFCQHFLAPLALMAHRDARLSQLLRVYVDGVPLDLASSLLPLRTRLMPSLLFHIHLHARAQRRFAGRAVDVSGLRMGRLSLLGLIESLESAVRGLRWKPSGTEWAEYYEEAALRGGYLQHKSRLVAEFLDRIGPMDVWDLGANVGVFSRIASDRGIPTISFDADPAAVEKNYLECRRRGETRILPLVLDLTNPSPAIGWGNEERASLMERGPADAVMALALIHHLAISNNLPLDRIARFFKDICRRWLIVEFVPKEDPQARRLLASREDIFPGYNQRAFEEEFGRYFSIEDSSGIGDSQRTLYLMRRLRG